MENNNTLSIILYIAIGIICLIISTQINKAPKRTIVLLILILTLLAGFRAESVGIDTSAYSQLLQSLRSGFRPQVSNITEIGFLWLSYCIVKISNGYTLLLTTYAFITNFFIIKRLDLSKQDISFPLAIFIYYFCYYFMTFNTLRQWIAMAIIFYFSYYIGKNKKGSLIFSASVLVSMLIHKTAIVAFLFLPMYYFIVSKKKGMRFQIARLLFLIGAPFIALLIYNYYESTYGLVYGLINDNGQFSFVTIIKLMFIIFIICFDYYNKKNISHCISNKQTMLDITTNIRFENVLYITGLCLTMLVYYYSYADRIGQFFILFELLVIPRYAKYKSIRQIVLLFIVILVVFLRIQSFRTNGYGELPYIPFWEMY